MGLQRMSLRYVSTFFYVSVFHWLSVSYTKVISNLYTGMLTVAKLFHSFNVATWLHAFSCTLLCGSP